jgi:hypothetical protein
MYRRLLFPTLLFIWLAGPRAEAVIIGAYPGSTNTDAVATDPPASLSGWNYVGTVNGSSCTYLGNGWMLSPDHVGIGNVTLNGATYTYNGNAARLNNPADGQPTDLLVFQVFQTVPLPNLALAYNSPSIGTSYYNVGYGLDRNTALQNYDSSFNITSGTPTYQGYGYGSPNTKTYGTNATIDAGTNQNTTTINIGYGNLVTFLGQFSQTTDQIVSGDSGGGVFNSANQLIGMNDAIGEYTGQETSNASSAALFGDQSYMADIATYYNQIDAITGVPEPSALLIVVAAAPLLLRRRPRCFKD